MTMMIEVDPKPATQAGPGDFDSLTEDLSIRRSHNFVDTFSDLDAWDVLGTFTILSSKTMEQKESDDETTTVVKRVLVEADSASVRDIERALIDSNEKRSCSHEYDCCGCRITGIQTVRHINRDVWEMTVNIYRNY